MIDHLDNKRLEEEADRLYLPKYGILDHAQAKLCYAMLAERADCTESVKYKSYCRLARISYLALNADDGDKYASKAREIYPDEIAPLMLGVDYEWYTHRQDYSDLYRYGKLPRIKALVDARNWQAMAYLLDRIIPLQDEGMRVYAELCETVLMETYRKSGEANHDAVAPVAFWKFVESTDWRKFVKSWYAQQLEGGVSHGSAQAMYYYAFMHELIASILIEKGHEKSAKPHREKAMHCYRRCVDYLDRRAMCGVVDMTLTYDPENTDLLFYIKCLRSFSYEGQAYPFLDGESDDPSADDDDYPDDDGRFDAYA